jgi:H/ACA ribonucleoprotein complex subunit 2
MISPIDVVVHLPIMCEDRQIPYFYVPSKTDLGAAASTKRPTRYYMLLCYYVYFVYYVY